MVVVVVVSLSLSLSLSLLKIAQRAVNNAIKCVLKWACFILGVFQVVIVVVCCLFCCF